MISFDMTNEYFARVVEWNRTAKNGHDFSHESFNLQESITKEEIDETLDAIKNNDKKEIMDGIADIFVTGMYLYFMHTKDEETYVCQFSEEMIKATDPSIVLSNMKRTLSQHTEIHYIDIQKLCCWAINAYGEDYVNEYFERVLRSNESKFIPLSSWDDKEIKIATKKYEPKGFTDIVAVDAVCNGNPVKILRADNGNGKILKPTSFQEP